MKSESSESTLLLVAHGERREGATNAGVLQLVEELRAAGLGEVQAAFLNGTPSVPDALRSIATARVIVYPLFLSAGYFSGVRLPALLSEGQRPGQAVHVMPPLGIDPGLADLVMAMATRASAAAGVDTRAACPVLLAHGSTKDTASRDSTRLLRDRIKERGVFRDVAAAFLEEPPALADAVPRRGPAIVAGLFIGEGMHGADDAPRLVAELAWDDVVFAGNIGAERGIADLIARSVREWRAISSPTPPAARP